MKSICHFQNEPGPALRVFVSNQVSSIFFYTNVRIGYTIGLGEREATLREVYFTIPPLS